MCSVSIVNQALGEATTAPLSVRTVSALQLQHSRTKYFLVDIREADEIAQDPVEATDAAEPMGKLFRIAGSAEGDALFAKWTSDNKIVVLLCSTGERATVTARQLGFAVLQRGVVGLRNPAATMPDLLVVLGTKDNAEKITLALTACANAANAGQVVVLGLLGDGVSTFLRKGTNKEKEVHFLTSETFVGEPFKPCDVLLASFLETGNGIVLGCTSCIKLRGLEFGSDLLDCVKPMQMPDLLRMLGEAKKSLQFI